jgi:hypothetical protein
MYLEARKYPVPHEEGMSNQQKNLVRKMTFLKETENSGEAGLRIQLGPAVGGPDADVSE